jgi:hypothetical protein
VCIFGGFDAFAGDDTTRMCGAMGGVRGNGGGNGECGAARQQIAGWEPALQNRLDAIVGSE